MPDLIVSSGKVYMRKRGKQKSTWNKSAWTDLLQKAAKRGGWIALIEETHHGT